MSSFPRIETIDDLLPHIEGKKGIKHWVKDGYQVIDYVVGKKSTFRGEDGELCPYALECRGIKFDLQGKLIARPFHKFFNLNEIPETELQNVSWKNNPTLFEKYDGSMIHPCPIVDNEGSRTWYLMTRNGITEQSKQAENLLRDIDYDFFDHCENMGVTPIYEWIGPENQHIVRYEENELVLLAMRFNTSGNYLEENELYNYATQYDQKIAVYTNIPPDPTRVVDMLKEIKNFEGYVYAFPSGFRIKVKGPEYVLAHRAKSAADYETKIIEMILSDNLEMDSGIDDFYSILEPEQQQKFDKYKSDVLTKISSLSSSIVFICNIITYLSRKEFALLILETAPKEEQYYFFKYRDYQEGKMEEFNLEDFMKRELLKLVQSKNSDRAKTLLNVTWENPFNG
jgi:RNA ligase